MIKSENWSHDWFESHGWQEELCLKSTMIEYKEVVEWLYDNVHNTESNVCWTYVGHPVFRFRKSKDQVLFMLRWT